MTQASIKNMANKSVDALQNAALLLLSTILVSVVVIAALIGSQTGLDITIACINQFTHIHIEAERMHGRIVGPLSVDHLRIDTPSMKIQLDQGRVNWSPKRLLQQQWCLKQAQLSGLRIIEKSQPPHIETANTTPWYSPSDAQPAWTWQIDHGVINDLYWKSAQQRLYTLSHLTIEAQANDHTQILQAHAQNDEAELHLDAEIARHQNPDWQITLKSKHLNLGILNPDMLSDLNLGIKITHQRPNTLATITDWSGTINDQPTTAQGTWQWQPDHDFTGDLTWTLGEQKLNIQGKGKQQLTWHAHFPQLQNLLPNASGQFISTGDMQWRQDPHSDHVWHGKMEVQLNALQWNDQFIGDAIDLKLDTTQARPLLEVLYQLDTVHWHTITAIQNDHNTLGHSLTGKVKLWSLNMNDETDWQLAKPTAWSLAPEHIHIDPFCLHTGPQKICAQLTWEKSKNLQAHLAMSQVELDQLRAWLPLGTEIPSQLSLQCDATGNAGKITNLKAKAHISSGDWVLVDQVMQHHIPIDDITVDIEKNAQQATMQGTIDLKQQKPMQWSLTLPDFHWPLTSSQAMQGQIDWESDQLDQLPLPNMNFVRGKIKWHNTITGHLRQPEVSGNLDLYDTTLHIPALGTDWQNIRLHMSGKGDALATTLYAEGQQSSEQLRAEGDIRWPNGTLTSELQLQGDDFPLIQNNQYKIWITPDLLWHSQGTESKLSGLLVIPKANITPKDFSQTETLSKDVKFSGSKTTEETLHLPLMDIQLVLKKNILILTHGLRGLLEGQLQIANTSHNRKPLATGLVQLADGTFTIYGQTLHIKRGNLSYNHTALENPNLDIRAERKIVEPSDSNNNLSSISPSANSMGSTITNSVNNTMGGLYNNITVGLDISGTPDDLNTTLFSIPSGIPENDILSYLVLGRSVGIDPSDSSTMMNAISSLGIDSDDDQLAEKLKRQAGSLDLSLVTNTTVDEEDQTSQNVGVAIGKYLTHKLYVSYSVGLVEPINTFKATYSINKNWSLQSVSSILGNGFDLIYSF